MKLISPPGSINILAGFESIRPFTMSRPLCLLSKVGEYVPIKVAVDFMVETIGCDAIWSVFSEELSVDSSVTLLL